MKRIPLSPHAFTLVEVTLALGITSFALLSILGGMMVGMNTLKGAIDTTVEAQITQHVVGSLKQANYSTIKNSTWSWAYDERGLPSSGGQPIYSASAEVVEATLSGGDPNPNLLQVKVTIENVTESAKPYTFSTFIANNGQ